MTTEITKINDPLKSTTVRTVGGVLRSVAIVNPNVAAKMASWFFFRTPPRLKARPNESEVLNGARQSEFKYRNQTIKLWEWGKQSDELILLVHGWGGSGAQLTPFVNPLLSSGFRVMALDLAGHGYSSGTRTSIPDMADMLVELVEQIGELNGLIAHSMGNSVAMLALARGLKLKQYVGIAGPLDPEFWFKEWVGGVVKGEAYLRERSRVESKLKTSLSDLNAAYLAKSRIEPMLWVHDKNDREVPISDGIEIAEAWPNAMIHQTERLGHRRILRDSGVVKVITEFVSKEGAISVS